MEREREVHGRGVIVGVGLCGRGEGIVRGYGRMVGMGLCGRGGVMWEL